MVKTIIIAVGLVLVLGAAEWLVDKGPSQKYIYCRCTD